jgi:hypothetical protein
MNSQDLAKAVTEILKDYKDYKIQDTPIIISSENYEVVQIKKNLQDFLAGNLVANAPKPNWDGTYEKAPVPVVPVKKVTPAATENNTDGEAPQQIGIGKGQKGADGDKNQGMPPTIQPLEENKGKK